MLVILHNWTARTDWIYWCQLVNSCTRPQVQQCSEGTSQGQDSLDLSLFMLTCCRMAS